MFIAEKNSRIHIRLIECVFMCRYTPTRSHINRNNKIKASFFYLLHLFFFFFLLLFVWWKINWLICCSRVQTTGIWMAFQICFFFFFFFWYLCGLSPQEDLVNTWFCSHSIYNLDFIYFSFVFWLPSSKHKSEANLSLEEEKRNKLNISLLHMQYWFGIGCCLYFMFFLFSFFLRLKSPHQT